MEDGLGDCEEIPEADVQKGLNPCFCGRWFGRYRVVTKQVLYLGLNPCFCGRWFGRAAWLMKKSHSYKVLILVFVEDGLGGTI